MPLLELDSAACRAHGLEHEWLETDGLGGFASSTVALGARRRYHGLLVALPPGLEKRHLFLARLDAAVGGAPLAPVRRGDGWTGADAWSAAFALVPYPSWTLRRGEVRVRREVLVVRGRRTVLVRFVLEGAPTAQRVTLRPYLACREADALTFANDALREDVARTPHGIELQPYDALPVLHLTFGRGGPGASTFDADPGWDRGLVHEEELARGYDGVEDLFSPGSETRTLGVGDAWIVGASIDGPVEAPEALWRLESSRRRAEATQGARRRDLLDLSTAAFLYEDGSGRAGVIAGYPWFGEWGRDTFLALPGLTLARGDLDGARRVLRGALPFLRRGLLPNIYGPTPDSSHYGSADAALWFARAVLAYDRAGAPRSELNDAFLPALERIAEDTLAGPHPDGLGVRVDAHGLFHAGSPELNATWMDAQTARGPVTPRDGSPVELAALWCSLLAHLAELSAGVEAGASARWSDLAERACARFRECFWLEDRQRLADRWNDGEQDARIRPNMVLAAALEFAPLSKAERRGVVACARRELLTPRGLRTLAPGDPDYVGTYGGDTERRDAAYHQGTVWPWLFGFYAEAALRATEDADATRRELRDWLAAFEPHLREAGLGHVSEVFDGDAPHRPGGAIAQAWSSAELVRARRLAEEGACAS